MVLQKIYKTLLHYRLEIIVLLFTVFLFFFLRLYHLKSLPIFVDEAIYARFAQLGKYDPQLRFVSLVDGKQPLYIWLTTVFMHVIYNPVVAGRFVSIVSGFVTLIGLFLLSFELFKNRWVSITSILLYVLYPFALVVNRMAIYESTVGMFFVWSLYIAVLLVRYISVGAALSMGLVLGGSILTKSSGFIHIYLLPVTLLLFPFKEKNYHKLLKWFLFALLACGLAFLYYSILFLSNKYYMIAEKDALFTYHFAELIPYHAFEKWPGQILQLLGWVGIYLTYPVALVSFFSLLRKKYRKEKLLLLLWFIIPLVGLGLFGRLLNPRYIFPITLSLLPLIAVTTIEFYNHLKNKVYLFIIIGISFLTYSDFNILTNMSHAPIPQTELNQYVNGSSNGEGLREIVAYLQKESAKGPIGIASEGAYGGLPATVVEIYFFHNTQVEQYSFDTLSKSLSSYLYQKANIKPVYLILNETQSVDSWPVDLVMQFKRGSSNLFLSLYKVRAPSDILK